MERKRPVTDDYCTFEEVRKPKMREEEDEFHLSFMLSGDFIRPVEQRGLSAQRK